MMRRRRTQYEAMSAQCFSALALSMKMQMGDAARQLSITSLYNEAASQKVSGAARCLCHDVRQQPLLLNTTGFSALQVPLDEWPTFIACALTKGAEGVTNYMATAGRNKHGAVRSQGAGCSAGYDDQGDDADDWYYDSKYETDCGTSAGATGAAAAGRPY